MRRLALILVCWCAVVVPLRAATVLWDPNPDPPVGGFTLTNSYRVEWGLASGVYTSSLNVGLNTSAMILSLTPGTYFFTVVAIDVQGHMARSSEVAFTVPSIPPPDPCAYPLGPAAVSVFPTRLQTTGSGGAGSKARIDFQVGSSLPIVRTAIRANGVDLSVITGTDLTAGAGQWFVVPSTPGTYTFSVQATNARGCIREQSTTFAITVP